MSYMRYNLLCRTFALFQRDRQSCITRSGFRAGDYSAGDNGNVAI